MAAVTGGNREAPGEGVRNRGGVKISGRFGVSKCKATVSRYPVGQIVREIGSASRISRNDTPTRSRFRVAARIAAESTANLNRLHPRRLAVIGVVGEGENKSEYEYESEYRFAEYE